MVCAPEDGRVSSRPAAMVITGMKKLGLAGLLKERVVRSGLIRGHMAADIKKIAKDLLATLDNIE